jgi:hypothetical protein
MSIVMKKSKASKPAAAASTSVKSPIELPDGMWERIAHKAYELWETRGRRNGSALQDWLDAEQIVMEEIHEARE